MSLIKPHVQATRARLSCQYLRGNGIEIGALHDALPNAANSVKYVDRMPNDQLLLQYPELADHRLFPVDIIDDGETLATIHQASQDFIIACHMLEHTQNPIGTIRNHLYKLKPGGMLYYIIPDKRFTFDVERPITTFDHLLMDDIDGGASSKEGHFIEWALKIGKVPNMEYAIKGAKELMEQDYSIHFHVWDANAWLSQLVRICDLLNGDLTVAHFEVNHDEVISILQRR